MAPSTLAEVAAIARPEQRLLKAAEAGLFYLQAIRDFVVETDGLDTAISELSAAIEEEKIEAKKMTA